MGSLEGNARVSYYGLSGERRSKDFLDLVIETHEKITSLRKCRHINLDGESLDIASVVAVTRFGIVAELARDSIISQINRGIDLLHTHLERGDLVYGVNTGYGGNADTRTDDLMSLQRALVQHLNSGIILTRHAEDGTLVDATGSSMPISWVRGMMLIRVNSILRGHSAVSMPIIESILTLLRQNITPIVPLRGSISASGDLMPLSYLAATIQGSRDILVHAGPGRGNRTLPASEALSLAGIHPVVFGAKEGLGLLNGTSASASVASIALSKGMNLMALGLALTAMSAEALGGTAESFHPFISRVRPHKGQSEAASSILSFLSESQIATGLVGKKDHSVEGLYQDRYALRTAPQWIGPLLEDLGLAAKQLAVELNSTTDNPLIDVDGDRIHHGGNFQASSVTAAMEKTRNALQNLGKLLFVQANEILNPATNRGLPPNLSADDPSTSFTCKGLDTALASYASELAWLNHPVGPVVQSAEMHNQGVNSLALISSRATVQSVEVLGHMCASHLFILCQALDLRVLLVRFLKDVTPRITCITLAAFAMAGAREIDLRTRASQIIKQLPLIWNSTSTMDLAARCKTTAERTAGLLVNALGELAESPATQVTFSVADVAKYRENVAVILDVAYSNARAEMFADASSITPRYIGFGAKALYTFVRCKLQVPFHRGLSDDPGMEDVISAEAYDGRIRRSVGSWTSIIRETIEDFRLEDHLLSAIKRRGWS